MDFNIFITQNIVLKEGGVCQDSVYTDVLYILIYIVLITREPVWSRKEEEGRVWLEDGENTQREDWYVLF